MKKILLIIATFGVTCIFTLKLTTPDFLPAEVAVYLAKKFTVKVDSSSTFTQMVVSGKYDSVDVDITEWRYPIPHLKQGIKVFSRTASFHSDKPIQSLQPEQIDSLIVVMNALDNKKLSAYVRKYGLINPRDVTAGKFNQYRFTVDTLHYKQPEKDVLTMKLFKMGKPLTSDYRYATAHETMAFGEEYPEVQRRFNIFALGSVFEENKGVVSDGWLKWRTVYWYYVTVLTGNNSVRKIQNVRIINGNRKIDWNKNSNRYLGVSVLKR